jgi:hypothetical protein
MSIPYLAPIRESLDARIEELEDEQKRQEERHEGDRSNPRSGTRWNRKFGEMSWRTAKRILMAWTNKTRFSEYWLNGAVTKIESGNSTGTVPR